MKTAINNKQGYIWVLALLLAFALVGYAAQARAADSLVYGDFGSEGIWKYDGAWSQLTKSNPESMVAWGSALCGDFGSGGIWKYDGTWSQLTNSNPEAVVTSASALYGDFAFGGIWKYDGTWSQLTNSNPESMVTSASALYGDFGSGGIWKYDGTWSQLTKSNPESMVASGSVLYGDFASGGIWKYDGTWNQLTKSNPESMVASASAFYGDFGSGGVWKYDGTIWERITWSDPQSMAVVDSFLYADFGSNGIWSYRVTTWERITSSDPQNMAAVDATMPTITETGQKDGDIGIATSAIISINFSEAMDQKSAEAAFSSAPALPSGTFGWVGNTMTFTPETSLNEATQYVITVGSGAKDLAGNPLPSAYTFSWRTALSDKVINLHGDFADSTSPGGVVPSSDGQYVFWWDGTVGEGSGCDVHLYRVKISDLSSQTIWANRSVWNMYDDGVNTWVGNYYPYQAAKISNSDLTFAGKDLSVGHTIGLNGNKSDFSNVYFGTSSSQGIGYWNRSNNTAGVIPGSNANIYQSVIIGNKVYFPRGSTMNSSGIMVVDAVDHPTSLETTLLAGDSRISNANDIYTDGAYLYVHNYSTNQIQKIDPTGPGAIEATFSPGVSLTNAAIVGDLIYAGVGNSKNVYLVHKTTGSLVIKDCSAYLPTAVGTPKWDYYNDGLWYGPTSNAKTAYFIPRSKIDNTCPTVN